MKAKELAEQLLKYPDFDIEFEVCVNYATYDHPWPEYDIFKVTGIQGIRHLSKIVVLEADVI